MGRTLPQLDLTQPSGFYQEINSNMMEEMWRTMAAQLHPDALNRRQCLEEVFDLLKDASWDDFWNIFPYELREHSSHLDELDALALLLASPVNKQRFQRYFEQYACLIVPAADRHSSAPVASLLPRQRRLGLPLIRFDNPAGDELQQYRHQQQQQQEQPIRRRGQLDAHGPARQQQLGLRANHTAHHGEHTGGPVAYVSPAAPGRVLAAAQPNPAAAGVVQPQQGMERYNTFAGDMLPAFGVNLLVGQWALPDAAQFRAAATAAGRHDQDEMAVAPPHYIGSSAGPSGAGPSTAAAAADGHRLTGRRRSWVEACETDVQPALAATQSSAAPAGGGLSAAATAGASIEAATGSAARDASRIWRAVHEALTEDDEGLLAIVSRLVPHNFAGQLCSEADSRKQLQALADSRPVPPHVVHAIADRLAAPSATQLVRLTASSGYSKRAAAAAAALECTTRTPFYIPLAGCHTEEAVEAAIMRGIFSDWQEQQQQEQGQQQPLPPQQQQQQEPPAQQQHAAEGDTAARAAATVLVPLPSATEASDDVAAQVATADEAAAAPAEGVAAGAVAAMILFNAALARAEVTAAVSEANPAEQGVVAPGAAAAAADGGNAATARHEGQPLPLPQQQQRQQQPEREDHAPGAAARQLQILRDIADFVGDMGMGVTLVDGSQEEEEMLDYSDSEGDEYVHDEGSDRYVEQLSAHLTLLGACSKQPLLLLLDEADSAMLSGGGTKFKMLLLRMLCQLPQVVVLVTDSFEPEGYAHSYGGGVLRLQGAPAVYSLPDSELTVGSYRLPRPYYVSCLHC